MDPNGILEYMMDLVDRVHAIFFYFVEWEGKQVGQEISKIQNQGLPEYLHGADVISVYKWW